MAGEGWQPDERHLAVVALLRAHPGMRRADIVAALPHIPDVPGAIDELARARMASAVILSTRPEGHAYRLTRGGKGLGEGAARDRD